MNVIHEYLKMAAVIAMVAVSISGCESGLEKDVTPSENMDEDGRIAAHIVSGPDTKTSMGTLDGNVYPVLWSETDQVAIFSNTLNSNGTHVYDGSRTYSLISGANSKDAVFKGGMIWNEKEPSLPVSCYPSDGAYYSSSNYKWSYPFRSFELHVGSVLPELQPYCKESFGQNVFPMAGVCDDKYNFYYHNLCGIIQLPIKGSGTVSKIFLYGNNEEPLAGRIALVYDFRQNTGSTITIATARSSSQACTDLQLDIDADNASQGIVVDCGENGLKLDPGKATMINIAVFPTTFTKGFTVAFVDKDNGGRFEKTTSQEITVKRSYVKTMEEFDYQTPEPLEPANCHVISKPGYYSIPAFCMGNRPKSARLDVSEDGKNNKTGNPVAADYLWTDITDPDAGGVTGITYIPGKDGYISFNVKADKNGNAPRGNTVIALYDSVTKEILWSWHIWMSDFNEVVTNGKCAGGTTDDGFMSEPASKSKMIIMDRNLGAVSADKNDGWKTYGLYYQMGRKDPFIGANNNGGDADDIPLYPSDNKPTHYDSQVKQYHPYEDNPFGEYTNHTEWNSNLTDGWKLEKRFITAETGRKEPMTYASSYDKEGDPRWTNKDLNTTAPFISKGGHEDFWNRTKTINDPCPAGWTVLGERNGVFFDKVKSVTQYHNGGAYGLEMTFDDNNVVWWPAAGFRSVDGTLGNIGDGGYYWAYDHIEASHGGHGWAWPGGTNVYDSKKDGYGKDVKCNIAVMTNHASVIRCVKAKQFGETPKN